MIMWVTAIFCISKQSNQVIKHIENWGRVSLKRVSGFFRLEFNICQTNVYYLLVR